MSNEELEAAKATILKLEKKLARKIEKVSIERQERAKIAVELDEIKEAERDSLDALQSGLCMLQNMFLLVSYRRP